MILVKQSYLDSGGHQSISRKILDDVMLAKNMKSQGMSIGFATGSNVSSVHMYQSLSEIFHG